MAEAQALYVAFVVLALMNIATGMFVQASLSAHERQREKAPKLGACFSCSAFLAMGVGIRRPHHGRVCWLAAMSCWSAKWHLSFSTTLGCGPLFIAHG